MIIRHVLARLGAFFRGALELPDISHRNFTAPSRRRDVDIDTIIRAARGRPDSTGERLRTIAHALTGVPRPAIYATVRKGGRNTGIHARRFRAALAGALANAIPRGDTLQLQPAYAHASAARRPSQCPHGYNGTWCTICYPNR